MPQILINLVGSFLVATTATIDQGLWLKSQGWGYFGPKWEGPHGKQLRALGFAGQHIRYLPVDRAGIAVSVVNDPSVTVSPEAMAVIAPKVKAAEVSREHHSEFQVPAPAGLSYRPYQCGGVATIVNNVKAGLPGTLIGDEMGLGKTMQAIGAMAVLAPVNVLVLCLASIRENWVREITKWLPSAKPRAVQSASQLAKVSVVSYTSLQGSSDRAKDLLEAITAQTWDMIVCDEAHTLKNEASQTSKRVLGSFKRGKLESPGIVQCGKHVVILTGTPIQNKVRESLPLFRAVGLIGEGKALGHDGQFLFRYCGPQKVNAGYKVVTTFDGSTNLQELQTRLRTSGVFVRRLKRDVAKELPPKVRSIVTTTCEGGDPCADLIPDTMQHWDTVHGLDFETASFQDISAYRAALAVYKAPAVIEHVSNVLEELEPNGKVLVFGHHASMLDALEKAFGHMAIRIDGQVNPADRLPLVDRFQNDPAIRVAILSTRAAGTGLTLTAASVVVFGEADWNPAMCVQAEDRAHRIGQEAESVTVQYIVIEGTLDARVITVMAQKMDIADRALDRQVAVAAAPVAPEVAPAPVAPTSTSTSRTVAIRLQGRTVDVTLTDDQIEACGEALQYLKGYCDGASKRDDVGFNGRDAHSPFVQSLVQTALAGRLSPKQAAWAYQAILPTYRNTQIAHLADRIWPRKG